MSSRPDGIAAETGPIDRDRLHRHYGVEAEPMLEALLPLLVEKLPADQVELRDALAAGDADRLARAAHGLLGAALAVCATDLATAAKQLEHRTHAGHLEGAADDVDRIESACGDIERFARGRAASDRNRTVSDDSEATS